MVEAFRGAAPYLLALLAILVLIVFLVSMAIYSFLLYLFPPIQGPELPPPDIITPVVDAVRHAFKAIVGDYDPFWLCFVFCWLVYLAVLWQWKRWRCRRLVVVTGGARGLGVGICRQVLERDSTTEVVIAARDLQAARRVAEELGTRAHAVVCDVTSTASCAAAAKEIATLRRDGPLSLVLNAGTALDLPWHKQPWPSHAASTTLAVNLYGARRITEALLPQLLASSSKHGSGRVVCISGGAGLTHLSRLSPARRAALTSDDITWDAIVALAAEFTSEYEAALRGTARLPYRSSSGLWLQSYGFSKACLGAWCRSLARAHPSLVCVACSPGLVSTDRIKGARDLLEDGYGCMDRQGAACVRFADEGGVVPAWLAAATPDVAHRSGSFYLMHGDVMHGKWVADWRLHDDMSTGLCEPRDAEWCGSWAGFKDHPRCFGAVAKGLFQLRGSKRR